MKGAVSLLRLHGMGRDIFIFYVVLKVVNNVVRSQIHQAHCMINVNMMLWW